MSVHSLPPRYPYEQPIHDAIHGDPSKIAKLFQTHLEYGIVQLNYALKSAAYQGKIGHVRQVMICAIRLKLQDYLDYPCAKTLASTRHFVELADELQRAIDDVQKVSDDTQF
jgi:hypothetical protein